MGPGTATGADDSSPRVVLSCTARPEECARESAGSSSAWCRVRRRSLLLLNTPSNAGQRSCRRQASPTALPRNHAPRGPETRCLDPARLPSHGAGRQLPRRHGARDPRRLALRVGVEVIRGAARDHRVSHRQQRARMDVARPSHADRTSAGIRAAVALDNRRARRIRVIRNCRRCSASLRRGWRA
jgi:hypothetical protein